MTFYQTLWHAHAHAVLEVNAFLHFFSDKNLRF